MRNLLPALALLGSGLFALALPSEPEHPAAAATSPAAAAQTNTPAAAPNQGGPHAEYAMPIYDFGRVQAGEMVKYTFVLTNVGDQTLEISHVQPSCGCTAAGDWTKTVEAGKTGSIPIQFNSANFNGQVFKTISVTSNDKQKPVMVLQLKGTVWKPIELVPTYTVINVPPDATNATATVRIINHTDDALTLGTPESTTPVFSATLSTNAPGKEYTVALNSVQALANANVQGKVKLTTSSAKTPVLEIPFWVNVQPPITIIPAHISLPATPLKAEAPTPTTVTIQNNSTNPLVLTDVAVNITNVDVVLKEVQPGRLFNAVVTFPPGFEPPPGKAIELSMKSSQPRMPQIHIPVVPSARPPLVTQPVTAPAQAKPTASSALLPPPANTAVR